MIKHYTRKYSVIVMRPPGALPELEFLIACTRCKRCVDACPPGAILLLSEKSGVAINTPFLDVNRYRACTACKTTPCITSCNDGALLPTAIENVRMGTAFIHRERCFEWLDTKDCDRCFRACPFPVDVLLTDEEGKPYIDPRTCIGCGICVKACPASPRAIEVDFGQKIKRDIVKKR